MNYFTNMFAKKLDVQLYGPARIVKMTETELQELRGIMKENPYLQEFVYDKEVKAQDKTKPTLDLTQLKQKLELKKAWWAANSEGLKTKRESIIALLTGIGMDKTKAEAIAKTYDKKREGLIPANVKNQYDGIMKDAPKDIFTLKEYQAWADSKNVKPSTAPIDPIDAINKSIDSMYLKAWTIEKTMRMCSERRKEMIKAHNAEIGKVGKKKEESKDSNTIVEI